MTGDRDVAIVTGGGSGIGRATAHALADTGSPVVVGDLDGDRAQTVAAEIVAAGGQAAAVRADVTEDEDAEAMVSLALETFGSLGILVNNAGHCRVLRFTDATAADAEALWRVHALGSFLCTRAALRPMLEARYGRIVMIVSGDGGYGASPVTTLYQSAKSAQTTLARGVALAVEEHGVTVNCVSPSLVETPLWAELDEDYRRVMGYSSRDEIERRIAASPRGRSLRPEEIARAVVFLASRAAGGINGRVLTI